MKAFGSYLLASVALACSASMDTTELDPELTAQDSETEWDGLEPVSPDVQAQTEIEMQRYMDAPQQEWLYDDLDTHIRENRRLEGFDDSTVQKAGPTLPATAGHAIRANLAYQDGLQTEPWPDHCSMFGVTCDNTWHAQARDVYYDNYLDYVDEFIGSCAYSGFGNPNVQNGWMPCMFPNLSSALGGRIQKWRFVDSGCGTATEKAHIRAGIIAALSNYTQSTGLTFTEVTNSSWNVIFSCGSVSDNVAIARWGVRGNLTLRAGLADAHAPVRVVEGCDYTSSIYPGRLDPDGTYSQDLDLLYTYSQGEIRIEPTRLFTYANCTTNASEIRRIIRNVMVHELGHHYGFQHNEFVHSDVGVMLPSMPSCNQSRQYSMGLPLDYKEAIRSIDFNNISTANSLDVYDHDLSCFRPNPANQPLFPY